MKSFLLFSVTVICPSPTLSATSAASPTLLLGRPAGRASAGAAVCVTCRRPLRRPAADSNASTSASSSSVIPISSIVISSESSLSGLTTSSGSFRFSSS